MSGGVGGEEGGRVKEKGGGLRWRRRRVGRVGGGEEGVLWGGRYGVEGGRGGCETAVGWGRGEVVWRGVMNAKGNWGWGGPM